MDVLTWRRELSESGDFGKRPVLPPGSWHVSFEAHTASRPYVYLNGGPYQFKKITGSVGNPWQWRAACTVAVSVGEEIQAYAYIDNPPSNEVGRPCVITAVRLGDYPGGDGRHD